MIGKTAKPGSNDWKSVLGRMKRWGVRKWYGWRGIPAPPEKGTTRYTGWWGEREAERFLRRKGWKVLGRNVRFGARMELDLVMRQPAPPVLVFVEVKTRRGEEWGRPADAVDAGKRRAVGRAGMKYWKSLGARRPRHWRFDVVEVVGEPGDQAPVVRHIEAAWTWGEG